MEYKLELSEKTMRRKLDYLLIMHRDNRLISWIEAVKDNYIIWGDEKERKFLPLLLEQITFISPRDIDDETIIEIIKAAI